MRVDTFYSDTLLGTYIIADTELNILNYVVDMTI